MAGRTRTGSEMMADVSEANKLFNYFNQSGIHNCDNYCNGIVQMINNSTNSKSGSNTGNNKG